jgi:hypothetical protein
MEYARAVRFGLKRRIRNARPLLLDENLSWQHPQKGRVEMWRGRFSDDAVSVCCLVATIRCLLWPITGIPVSTSLGFPCCARFPCVHAAATTPAQRLCSYLLNPTVVSVFPDTAFGSTCASSFSRLARRSLALRPAHSRCHQFVASFTQRLQPFRYLHSRSGCFRLELWPGGSLTHWKAPPFHGAR